MKKNNKQSIDNTYQLNFISSIRSRLLFGFGVIVLVFMVTVFINLTQNLNTQSFTKQMLTQNIPALELIDSLIIETQNSMLDLRMYLISGDSDFIKLRKEAWKNINKIHGELNHLLTKMNTSNYQETWGLISGLLTKLEGIQNKIESAAQNGNKVLSIQLLKTDATPTSSELMGYLLGKKEDSGVQTGGFLQSFTTEFKNHNLNISKQVNQVIFSQWILLGIGILISLVIIILTTKNITTPLNSAIDFSKRIASGQRDVAVPASHLRETTLLFQAMDTMQNAIKENEENLHNSEEKIRSILERVMSDVKYYSEHIDKVAMGDLTKRLEIQNKNELSELGKNLNIMTDSLASISKQINESSHHMSTSLSEVNSAIVSQTSGATEQASAINEITSTLEELEMSSSQNLEKVRTLGKSAEKTNKETQIGLDSVKKSIAGMHQIRDKVKAIADTILELSNLSQRISEITSAVSDIAKQSKMLSLNASIEAAKAGEAGRGFSVVAEEVRNLAEQSERSTKQVQQILDDVRKSTEKAVMATEEGTKGVDAGMKLTEHTGTTMESLRQVINDTTMACQQLVAASQQESAGIKQITGGMDEINKVTTSFVASVKQTSEAIDNLVHISNKLKENVDIYRVN